MTESAHTSYQRVFGIGPVGTLISLVLLGMAAGLRELLHLPSLGLSFSLRLAVLVIASCGTVAIVVWSVRSLPVDSRGRELCTRGAFRVFRHPLYAAFLSVFNFGFALYLNHSVYLLWAVALHPLWHWLVRREERLMVSGFGEQYEQYAERTGRFFPRLR
jgi:protein-S-isoprenylcysteine O-methyltransferase Ste14